MKLYCLRTLQSFLKKRVGIIAIIGLILPLLFFPLAKIFSLHSSFFDLGIFESVAYRMASSHDLQLSFAAGHTHGFYPLYGWLYGMFPPSVAPYFLVGSQALFLALPGFYFFRRFGVFAAFAYVAYYPVWVNALFDFHFDHLVIPLMLVFYVALLDRRIGWAVLGATLLMLVKETFALETVACGVLLLWASMHSKSVWQEDIGRSCKRKLLVGALWLIVVGSGYFFLATHYLIPYYGFSDGQGFHGGTAFGWLGNSLTEMASTIVTQPQAVIHDIITTLGKLKYLGVVFGLLAFIPLLRPIFLIPALPMLAIAMLSQVSDHYDYNSHYMAGVIMPVMAAFVLGLPKAENIWMGLYGKFARPISCPASPSSALVMALPEERLASWRRFFYLVLGTWVLAGHMLLSPSPISRLFWSDKVWTYSWRAYVPAKRDAMIKMAIERYIPGDPKVSVATQNTVNWGHLAHREVYLYFPLGIAEPYKLMGERHQTWDGFLSFLRTGYKPKNISRDRYADYVVLDLKRPYFLADRGCLWLYGACTDKKMEKNFLSWVAYTQSIYDTIFEQDGFMILRRRRVSE